MHYEIERKFLVLHPPISYETYPHEYITQGYIQLPNTKQWTRIRKIQKDQQITYTLTQKKGKELKRKETESTISQEMFTRYWKEVGARYIEKVRYYIPDHQGVITLDVYISFPGFMIAEREFSSEEEAQ